MNRIESVLLMQPSQPSNIKEIKTLDVNELKKKLNSMDSYYSKHYTIFPFIKNVPIDDEIKYGHTWYRGDQWDNNPNSLVYIQVSYTGDPNSDRRWSRTGFTRAMWTPKPQILHSTEKSKIGLVSLDPQQLFQAWVFPAWYTMQYLETAQQYDETIKSIYQEIVNPGYLAKELRKPILKRK